MVGRNILAFTAVSRRDCTHTHTHMETDLIEIRAFSKREPPTIEISPLSIFSPGWIISLFFWLLFIALFRRAVVSSSFLHIFTRLITMQNLQNVGMCISFVIMSLLDRSPVKLPVVSIFARVHIYAESLSRSIHA